MTFPYLGETKELNEITRKQLGGMYATLSDGETYYELTGDENAPLVTLVHGFSVPSFIFDPTFRFLTQNGFRALRYDLFGRGFSDRPRVKYDIHLFTRQLKELLDALNISQTHLIGLSMGGVITASFIASHPQYVTRWALIDPAGAEKIELPFTIKAAQIPLLGEMAFGLLGSGNMVKGIAGDLFDKSLVEHFQARYKIQMQYKGFKRAILSTIRSGMLNSFYETYQRVGQLQKPTMLFWGRQDQTVPYEHSAILQKAMPHAKLITFENCGHIPHYEKPQEFNAALLEFLK